MSTHGQEKPELEAYVSWSRWRALHDPHLHIISWQGLEKDEVKHLRLSLREKVCACVIWRVQPSGRATPSLIHGQLLLFQAGVALQMTFLPHQIHFSAVRWQWTLLCTTLND